MLKKIFLALTVAVTVVSSTACGFKKTLSREVDVGVPTKMVYMGDSIAAGYGLEGYTPQDNYNCRSYSNILKDTYTAELDGKCSHEMLNVAVSGDTSQQLLDHIQSGEFDAALKGSDAVIISIGGNDILEIFLAYLQDKIGFDENGIDLTDIDVLSLLGGYTEMDKQIDEALDGFEGNLQEIITAVKGRSTGDIYVQTLYNPLEYFEIEFLTNFSNEKIGRLNEIIKNNAEYGDEHYYTVIDLAPDFEGRCGDITTIKQYDIHPNAEGHEVIARAVDKALRQGTYSYTEYYEVADSAKTVRFVIVCAAGVLAAVIVITVMAKGRKRS